MSKRVLTALVVVLVATNILAVSAWLTTKRTNASDQTQLSQQDRYPLLAKRLFTENPNDVIVNFAPLRDALNQYFATNIKVPHSFYFQYLPSGTSIRINGTDELIGASLLKLPVVMNMYKAEELGKVDLDKSISLKQEWLDDKFGDLHKRGAGSNITLRQAAELVLKDSDNTAVNAIQATINPLLTPSQHVLVEIDVPHTLTTDGRVQISAQSYAYLLRCLNLSCFLSKDHSQDILEMMVGSEDAGRLAAGVPSNVPVAHKIGTYGSMTQSDCGIVYYEARPYLICMIVDQSDTEASRHIKAVSSLIYQYVSAQE